MKKSANAAMASHRFDLPPGRSNGAPVIYGSGKQKPKPTLAVYKGTGEPVRKKQFLSIPVNYNTEQIKDLMWLLAAIVIICILHRNLPNSGAPPHSIVEIARSVRLFP